MNILKYFRLVFLLTLSFCFLSCGKSIKSKIDNDSYKYWVPDDASSHYYYFGSDFKCKVFTKIDGIFKEYVIPDVYYSDRWFLKGDSIIIIRDWKYKIYKITENKMVLKHDHGFSTFMAVPDNRIPKNYQKNYKIPKFFML